MTARKESQENFFRGGGWLSLWASDVSQSVKLNCGALKGQQSTLALKSFSPHHLLLDLSTIFAWLNFVFVFGTGSVYLPHKYTPCHMTWFESAKLSGTTLENSNQHTSFFSRKKVMHKGFKSSTRSRSCLRCMNIFILAMRVSSRCLDNMSASSVFGINKGRSKLACNKCKRYEACGSLYRTAALCPVAQFQDLTATVVVHIHTHLSSDQTQCHMQMYMKSVYAHMQL